jgi:hypothetical protein
MNRDFSRICTPAKIYFAIAVISGLFELFNGFEFMFIGMKLIFAFVWTFILSVLCKKGFSSLSWFLVLLPYLIIALGLLGIYRHNREHTQILRTLQLQGAFGKEAMTNGDSNGKKK